MRIVLDSNVIVAAFAARGLCKDVFALVIEDHQLVTSDFILGESRRILSEKINLKGNIVSDINNLLKTKGIVVEPEEVEHNELSDPGDLPILGTASAGNARVILNGDSDLLDIKTYNEIPVYSPRKFWETQTDRE
ncbi:MAG: putative toxin-antitoxin system toxin component, PIN family [bacterium]